MSKQFIWQRPENLVPYPNIWLEFMAKESKTSDKLVKYVIKDLPEHRFDDVLNYIAKEFLADAAVTQTFGEFQFNFYQL